MHFKILLLSLIIIGLVSSDVFSQAAVVFESGKEGNASYRIPAIIKLQTGKILAFAEGRQKGAGDFGDVNIVLKISADNGKTWSALQDVAENGSLQAGNPAPVVDYFDSKYPKGRVFLFYNTGNNTEKQVRNGNGRREVWYKTSTDEGQTWSQATNITAQVHKSIEFKDIWKVDALTAWRSFANTPGHALQITQGKYRGRIFVPINYSKGEPSKTFEDYMAAAFYTDDHGATFKLSDNIGFNGSNESTAAELPNNGILLNSRNQKSDQKYRITAKSNDGGQTWNNVHFDINLPDPICEGSLLTIKNKNGKSIIAFSNNADQKNRNNLTLRISFDEGKTWAWSKLIDSLADSKSEDFTAYSDIVMIDKKRIAILYEKNDYQKIIFKIISWK